MIALATSAYSSFSSCRQYLDDIDRARAAVGPDAPAVIKIPPYYRHPGFIGSFIDATTAAIGSLPQEAAAGAELIFTAHSIPASMAAASGPAGGAYAAQLAVVAEAVTTGVGRSSWRLAYQSRSGPPSVPWLEPDISDCLEEVAAAGATAAVVVPIGFVSDHMEIKFDLDTEAAQTAARLGLPLARAATPGTAPRFVSMISALAPSSQPGRPGPPPKRLGPGAASFCRAGCCGSDLDRSAGLLAAGAQAQVQAGEQQAWARRRAQTTGPEPGELLGLPARRPARPASCWPTAAAGRTVVSTKSSPTDIVTEMDRAAEQLIRDRIGARRPEDAILGEEGGQTGERRAGPLGRRSAGWHRQLPVWPAGLGGQHRRRGRRRRSSPERSACRAAMPCTTRPSAAAPGGSACRRRRVAAAGPEPLACNTGVPLERALVATGFGYDPGRRTVQGQVVGAVLPRVRDIRRNGACAVDLCSLAAGQVDGYYERGVQYWDIAAGSLIAREAGAIVAGLAGKPAGEAMTVGGGPGLFAELHDLLLSLRPERDAS